MSRRRALVLHQGANLASGVSNSVVIIAIPWLIIDRTGSAATAGLAGALAGLPGIAVSPLVGAMVDRLGRKTVSVGSDVLSAASVALFPLAEALDVLGLAVILALTLLGAVFDPAGYTARKSLIPDVAQASATPVDTLNGLHEGLFAAGWVLGPMLGAFAIATVGPVGAMWFACAGFVLASFAIATLDVPDRAVSAETEGEDDHDSRPAAFSDRALVGLRALAADRPVWILTLAIAVIAMIYGPTETVLLPVHFEALDEPRAFGFVLSGLAGGAMVGAFGFGWLAARMSRHMIAKVFVGLACLAYFPLALLPPTALMVAAAALLGLAWGPLNPLLNSLIQDRFPADQHGRIYGVQLAIFYAAPPLGQLVAGLTVDWLGVRPVILGVAAALAAMAAIVALQPSLRGLDGAGRMEDRPRRSRISG